MLQSFEKVRSKNCLLDTFNCSITYAKDIVLLTHSLDEYRVYYFKSKGFMKYSGAFLMRATV